MIYSIWTDASIEPENPGGILAWAFLVKHNNIVIHQQAKIHGWGPDMTNNKGEYLAVVAAVHWLLELPKEKQLMTVINSDSQLIVNQCMGTWKCNDKDLMVYNRLITEGKKRYSKDIHMKWVSRERNKEADALSRSLYTEKALALFKKRRMDILFEGDDIPW